MCSVSALWIPPMASLTPCMSVTSTTSSSGSTACAPLWPSSSRRLPPEFIRASPSGKSVALPISQSVMRRQTRTVHQSLCLHSGLRPSPKPDWTRHYRDQLRGRKPECRHSTRVTLRQTCMLNVCLSVHFIATILFLLLSLCSCTEKPARSFPSKCRTNISP